MTIIPGGDFGFAPQATKIGSGAFTVGSYTWRRFKTLSIAPMGFVENQDIMGQEIGGGLTPAGAFKISRHFAAQVDFIPRISGLGFLLYGLMGMASATADSPEAGMTRHVFKFNPDGEEIIPWMAFRYRIPSQPNLGIVGYDCKVVSMRLTIPPAGGQVAARLMVVGRCAVLDAAPGSWSWANDYADHTSVPSSANGGYFKWPTISSSEQPVTGMQIVISNGLTDPVREELIVGDYAPDTFATRARAMSVSLDYKINDMTFWRRVLTGAADGTTWTAAPLLTELAAQNHAFDLKVASPANISGYSNPYTMQVRASKAVWQADPITAAAARIMTMGITGTVLGQASGQEYAELILENTDASYAWPV